MNSRVTGHIKSIEFLLNKTTGHYYKIIVQTIENKLTLYGWATNCVLMNQLKMRKIKGKIKMRIK